MTSAPTLRPPAPAAPLRGPSPAGPAPTQIGASALDPIKLFRKYKWLLGAAALAGAILGVVANMALLKLYPIYTAEIVYLAYPQQDEVAKGEVGPNYSDELKNFMATQVQFMTSQRVIDAALDDPQLQGNAPDWYRAYTRKGVLDKSLASKRLAWGLGAGVMGDSSLIRLSFWWRDDDDAKAIVDTVGRTYLRHLQQQGEIESREKKDAIQKQIDSTGEEIGKNQRERARLLGDASIQVIDDRYNEAVQAQAFIQEKLTEVQQAREAAVVELKEMQAELAKSTGPVYPDRIRQTVESSPVIMNLRVQVQALEGEVQALTQRGVLPEHVSMKQTVSRLDGMKNAYEAEFQRLLRQGFDTHMDSLRTAISQLNAQEMQHMAELESKKTRANEIAMTLARVRDIDLEIENLNLAKTEFGTDLQKLQAMGNLKSAYRVREYQGAQIPREVTFPKLYVMIPAGVLLLGGLVAGVILLAELVDTRVKSPADIAMIPRAPLVGLIPHASEDPAAPQRVETVFRDQPGGVMAEAYRQARGTLMKRLSQGGHKSLLVASGMPGSGTSTAIINLAYAFAAAEHRVLIVDANFRRPTLHKSLGLAEGPGLGEVLAGSATLAAAAQTTDNERLHILAAGAPGVRRVEQLSGNAFTELLRKAGAEYDLVLIDAAPTVVAGDAMLLANRCDAVMLVVRAFSEKRGMVARLRNELAETRAEFVGVLVNGAKSAAGGYLRGNIQASHKYRNGQE